MPSNFEQLGAREEDIQKLAETCCYGNGNSGYVYGFTKLSKEDVENIYRLML